MAVKYVDIQEQLSKKSEMYLAAQAELKLLKRKLESMRPSKLSSLTTEWINMYTPFRHKVTFSAFLMKMILPNARHAWGFAGYNDEFDDL